MGLFTYTIAGGGFILIGSWESLLSSCEVLKLATTSPSSPPLTQSQSTDRIHHAGPFSPLVTFVSISVLSFLSILNSVISLSDALSSKDRIGSAIQLELLAISLLFFLYSVMGLLTRAKKCGFPSVILNLLYVFAFVEEFLLFYLQRKDPSGIENRYYDLLLVPIAVCVFSTILELKNPKSNYARLGRGIGLVLQGMWIMQMGVSFFSDLIANGCSLHVKSRGNFTVKCKGHPEYHRGRAIATLQFDCHLAILVALIVVVYTIVCRRHGIHREFIAYQPLGPEMQHLDIDSQARFTLDSEDDNDDENGAKEEKNVEMQKSVLILPESGINGYGNQH